VHLKELSEVTHVLELEPGTKLSLKRRERRSIIAHCGNLVHVESDHGGNVTIAEDVDAGVGDALLPTVIDKPCMREQVELARGLLQAEEAAFEMTHFRRAIGEAKGLTYVHVLFPRSVEERSSN
jgi:hypothetical protein